MSYYLLYVGTPDHALPHFRVTSHRVDGPPDDRRLIAETYPDGEQVVFEHGEWNHYIDVPPSSSEWRTLHRLGGIPED